MFFVNFSKADLRGRRRRRGGRVMLKCSDPVSSEREAWGLVAIWSLTG